jgi:predicted lipoprotein with Yx(FWY)xxD motif
VHDTRGRFRFAAAAVVAVALLAGMLASVAGATGARSAADAKVMVRKTALGVVLVDSRGHSLYLFQKDRGGKSACYGGCAAFWPPLLTSGKPVAGSGVKAVLLGTVKRSDGKLQVTYAGHPLYGFALDRKAGQTNGEGSNDFGAKWYVLAPSGKKIDND